MTIRRKWIFAIIIFAILIFPVGSVQRRDDGGAVEYLSLTWQLENCRILHRERNTDGYILVKRFYFLGICLYDGTYFVSNDQMKKHMRSSSFKKRILQTIAVPKASAPGTAIVF